MNIYSIVALLCFAGGDATKDLLAQELSPTVAALATGLKQHGGQVDLGNVELPPVAVTGAKGLILDALEASLTMNKVKVGDGAEFTLNTKIEFVVQQSRSEGVAQFSFKLVNGLGNEIRIDVPQIGVKTPQILAVIAGVNLELNPTAPKKVERENNKAVIDTLINPKAQKLPIADKRITIDEYSVAILIDDSPLDIIGKGGHAETAIPRNKAYKIHFINNSEYDAVIEVLIDGLSMFKFAEKPEFSRMMIPRKSDFAIPGWFINTSLSKQFVVRGAADLTDARRKFLTPDEEAGAIQIIVHQAWTDEEKGPSLAPDRTDLGADVKQNYVPVKRNIGNQKAVFSIVYSK